MFGKKIPISLVQGCPPPSPRTTPALLDLPYRGTSLKRNYRGTSLIRNYRGTSLIRNYKSKQQVDDLLVKVDNLIS